MPTLVHAREVLRRHDSAGAIHRRGHDWVRLRYLPGLRKLEQGAARADQRRAARGWRLIGDVHDLNGAPRAAVRAYQRALRMAPQQPGPWHAIGCMLDNMGSFQRARHALLRAVSLAPNDELLRGDLERVEWAMFNPCPVLFEADNPLWEGAEELAAGRPNQALARLGRRRSVRARQVRARIHGARGDADGALAQWEAIASMSGRVQLQLADWYYTLQGPSADSPALWRLMLWKIRRRLDGGAQRLPPTLDELDVPEGKRFELYVRYQLARTEGDMQALLGLATKYPTWKEPGEAVLRLG
jgi:tetratricopeptide (TPR) repeat protein